MVSPVQENVHRQAIEELLELFSRGCDNTTFIGRATSVVAKTLQVDYAAVLERASDANDLVLRAGIGWNENLIGTVVGHAEIEALEEYARLARLPIRASSHRFSVPLFDHVGSDSSMAVVIGGRGRRFGLLSILSSHSREFDADEQRFLQDVADLLGQAVDQPALRRTGPGEPSLRVMVDQLPVIIWSTDRFLRFTSAIGARAAEWGIPPSHVQSTTVFEVFGTADEAAPPIASHLRAIDRQPAAFEATLKGRSYRFYVEPLLDRFGDVKGATGIAFDVTGVPAAAPQAPASRSGGELYRVITDNLTDMIWKQDARGTCSYVSPACRALLQFEPEEIIGRSIFEFIHPDEIEEIRELQELLLTESSSSTLTYRLRRKDGSYRWFETTSRAIRDDQNHTVQEIVAVSRDITDRKRNEEQIEYQAYHDPLTGMPNRILFEDRVSLALAQARRYSRKVAVMFIDLDRFKMVNDSLGHAVGDQLLQAVAYRLSGCLRATDTFARLGGDEFTVLLSHMTDEHEAVNVAEKLVERISQPFFLGGNELYVGASIGIALYPNDGTDVQTLMRCADAAMYWSKEMGGNTFQLHLSPMNAGVIKRLSVETDLRKALDKQELIFNYQPQIELSSGRIAGLEALIRWQHPIRGIVQPDVFIPLAEESRLITQIGEIMLGTACRQLKQWHEAGWKDLTVAVNLSTRQFQESGLIRAIERVLSDTGLSPAHLELEITESTAMHNADQSIAILRILKDMGLRLAIDDFGTGYSSLNYLKQYPVDHLKIDKTFIDGIGKTGADRAIVTAIIEMAHALSLKVIAEGVETEDQKSFLRDQECDLVQGYLFSKPVDPSEIDGLMRVNQKNHAR